MRRLLSLTTLVLVVASLSACDSGNPGDEAPALIAPDLFEIDTSLFATPAASKVETKENFINAAVRVWPVSIVMTASLVLPAAVTNAALQDQPEFVDGAWRWESTATFNANTATFGLNAEPEGNGHNWSAVVSFYDAGTQTQLNDFVLYSGRTQNGGTEGNWSLYLPIDGVSTNVLNADFLRSSETDKTVTFSIPAAADANGGDSVAYTVDGNDRTFVWTQVTAGITHTVEWNALTGEGSITATNFKNGQKSCWDSNQDDIDCPAGT